MREVAPTIDANMDRKFGSNQWVDGGQYVICGRPSDVPERGGGK